MNFGGLTWRYRFGGGPEVKPPPLPPPPPTMVEIGDQAMKASEAERRRLGRGKGRGATILTPGVLTPAQTTRAGLKQKLG